MSEAPSLADLHIRRARPDEAQTLTRLALRSKASWGYDADFMRDVETELTISPSAVESVPFYVVEHAGCIIGFYSLSSAGNRCADLTDLFVEPDFARRGIGTRLLAHARQVALAEGHHSLLIHSDPHAEPFYRSAGAVYAGETPSGSIAGRMLPLMRIDLTPSTDG